MTTYLNQILYQNKKFDSFDTIQLLQPFMYKKEEIIVDTTSVDSPLIVAINPIINQSTIHTSTIQSIKNTSNIIHPKCIDTLFWCMYIAKNGYSEYLTIGQKYRNVEIENKQQMIETIKKNPSILKNGSGLKTSSSLKTESGLKTSSRKITNVAIQEIMAELMIDKKTSMKTFYAMCVLNELNMYIVDTTTKTYLDFANTSLSNTVDTSAKSYIIYRSVEGFFSVDIEEKQTEQLDQILSELFELEHGERPIKAISAYKISDLETISKKLGLSNNKAKKQDMYNEILVRCLWK